MKHSSIVSTERFIIAAFVLCVGGSLLIYQQIDRQHRKADLVTHSYILKITLNQLLLNLAEAETNQRGFLLTRDPDFLQHYQEAIRKFRSLLGIVDSLTIDNPRQRERQAKLLDQYNRRALDLHAKMIMPVGNSSVDVLNDELVQNTKEIFDNLRITAYSMLETEDRLLRQRIIDKEEAAKTNPYLSLTVFLLFMSLVFLGYLKLKKETGLRIDSDEQLSMQNAIFRQAEKMAMIGNYTWNATIGEMRLSENFYRLLGYEPKEFVPSPEALLRLVHPADKHRALHNGQPTLERMIQSARPCRFITKDGVIKYLRATGSPVLKPEGEMLVGTFQDVTTDVEMRQVLEDNDNFIRSLLSIAPSIITIFDVDSQHIVFTSRRYLASLDQVLEVPASLNTLAELIHPEDREAAIHYFRTLGQLQDQEMSEFEYRVRGRNGNYRYWLTRNAPYKRSADNRAIQFINATIDITEKVKAQMELKAKTEALLISRYEQQNASRFKVLADSMPQIVWTADPNGDIDYFNQRWYDVMQPAADEALPLQVTENMYPDDRNDYFTRWHASLETGKPFQVECRFKDHKHPGEYCWFLAKALPIYDADGSIQKWHGTFTDINDQKSAELAVQRLVKEKEDFISIASHELKTPVTILKGSIQLLEQEARSHTLSQDMTRLIEMAGRQVKKLASMVGDLLDVAKLDADRIKMTKYDFLLKDVIDDSIEQVNSLAAKSSIQVSGPTDLTVHANKERIGQVITNFLSNALKYSPEGSQIDIMSSREGNFVKVAVTDAGIGIPVSKLPFVFDRFFRVEDPSIKSSGLGLGLYISAEIISRHEGEIGVTSEPGKGSTFWFTLPVEVAGF